jgi:hypothetical protein
MPRIIVTADHPCEGSAPVLLDESVYSVHLKSGHAATQLIERLGWALNDAEEIERGQTDRGQTERGQPDLRPPMRTPDRGARIARGRSAEVRRSVQA